MKEPKLVPQEQIEDFLIDESSYKTLLTNKFRSRVFYTPSDLKKVISFIPGTIKKISVKEGQRVRKGDILVVLEAMKMANEILAPLTGKVDKIYVKIGARVSKNELLVDLK